MYALTILKSSPTDYNIINSAYLVYKKRYLLGHYRKRNLFQFLLIAKLETKFCLEKQY